MMGGKGTLIVVSAPSGAGKSTLIRGLMKEVGGISFSVSHTTRKPRPGEVDGRDYHFVDEAAFRRMIEEDGFLEWATVHGNLYGTSRAEVEARLATGEDVILDIDVQGCDQVAFHMPDAVTVFILPPSLEELDRRLRNRNKDSAEVIETRISNAAREIDRAGGYDHRIVNDDFPTALAEFSELVRALRAGRSTERPN